MIRLIFLDGNTVDINSDDWSLNGPVLQVGTAAIPVQHIRLWETMTPSDDTGGSEPDGV